MSTPIPCRIGRFERRTFASAVRRARIVVDGIRVEPEPEPPQADLRDVVRGTPDAAWVDDVHDVLASHDDASLLECVHAPEDGGLTLVIVAQAGRRADVARGDTMIAGFAALRDGDADVAIWPRHVRCVCTNGTSVPTELGDDLVAQGATPADAMRACLSDATVAAATQVFRRLAMRVMSSADVTRLLARLPDEATRERVRTRLAFEARQTADSPRIFVVYERSIKEGRAGRRPRQLGRPTTAWDAFNAITATARDLDDVRRRIDLERIGARLVAPLLEDGALAGPSLEAWRRRMAAAQAAARAARRARETSSTT